MNKAKDFIHVTMSNTFKHFDKKHVKYMSFEELQNSIISSKFKSVIFHYLNTANLRLISRAPIGIKLCWVVYGVEVFSQRRFRNLFLTNKTIAQTRFSFDKTILDKVFWRTKTKLNMQKALRRLDYAAMWIDGDYQFLKEKTSAHKIKMIPFCYPAKLLNIGANSSKRILVGNNGFITNNHFDGIDYIINNNLEKEYEIIFLMTTDEGIYKRKVFKYAQKHLGKKFRFIEEKLDYDAFLHLLSTVEIAIFPHLRSQGGVTTRSLLYFGKTVVSYSKSNLYKKLSSLGCTIIGMDEPFRILSDKEKTENKKSIDSHFGAEGQSRSINNLIENLR